MPLLNGDLSFIGDGGQRESETHAEILQLKPKFNTDFTWASNKKANKSYMEVISQKKYRPA